MRFSIVKRSSAIFLSFLILAIHANGLAAEYEVDKAHSSVAFEVKHLFTKAKGLFRDFEGKFQFDEKKLDGSDVMFTIKSTSVDTNNGKRDDHIRSADFFDVGKHPEIKFKSKNVKKSGKGKYKITGDLSLRGVTKEVVFNAEFLGAGKDPYGNQIASFTAETKINRKDFGVNWSKVADNGGLVVGDEVKIEVQIEGRKKVE